MLKQTVSYFDFDDNPSQETLYFNLTKTELADNIHLRDELEEMQKQWDAQNAEIMKTHPPATPDPAPPAAEIPPPEGPSPEGAPQQP